MSHLSQTHPISDSGLTISLHPLILLTISDYITRHTLRHQARPIVGALLGQQNGRSLTLEHAFECETIEAQSPFATGEAQAPGRQQQILLHEAWFKDRLQQYKDVHKAPALELVGWFTTTPVTGPEATQLPIHMQILQGYNETAVLLAFHPMGVLEGPGIGGGKLPLTIYESVYESAEGAGPGAGAMEVDDDVGEENAGAATEPGLELKFRELPYIVETGEAEMIGVDFVARGGGNATAVDVVEGKTKGKEDKSEKAADTRGAKESKAVDDCLSAEDEELIASLTARVNAVKMLHTRISLLKSYLSSLPPSYLISNPNTNTTSTTTSPPPPPPQQQEDSELKEEEEEGQQPNHPPLRSILALLSRLPLLQPSTPTALATFTSETLAEKSDVELVSLLGALGRSVKDARELGRKFGVVEGARGAVRKSNNAGGGRGAGMLGGGGDMGLRGGGGEGDGGLMGFGEESWGSRGGGGGGDSVWGNGFVG